jgi:hypothetical protein
MPRRNGLFECHSKKNRSPRARREMLGQVPREQVIQVHGRARAFKDAVSAIGIGHEVERLPQGDQLVDQQLRPLVMNIVVARAVHNQQMAL